MAETEKAAAGGILDAIGKLTETKGPGYVDGLIDGINLIPTAQPESTESGN